MNTLLLILLVAAVAVIIWVAVRKSKVTTPPPGHAADWEASDRRNLLEEARTVFSGAQTQQQRLSFVNQNWARIQKANNHEDFAVEYSKLEKQYGLV